MTPGRKTPHCKTCHKPLKGHRRGICDNTDEPSSPAVLPPSCSVGAKTQKSAPPPLETLSTESKQILNDLLRANSHTAPPLQVPEFRPTKPRRSGRGVKQDELLRDALDAEIEEQKPSENPTPSEHDESNAMPGAWEKSVPQIQSQTSTLPWSSSHVLSQQLTVKASSKGSSVDPLIVTISQQLKLEDFTPGGPQFSVSDVPPASLIIQNFLDGMARSPQLPPAIIFSYPIDGMRSLEDNVKSHGLCMHILSLPKSKEEWSPVVIGRDKNAITKLLEDGERLAQGLRRPDKFNVRELDLRMSHVVVGALGALATWAGLAYA